MRYGPDMSQPGPEPRMAERVAAFDWASTPLGPIESWPGRLTGVVELALASPMVAAVACGPERLLIYNDAAARLYGDRHPAALGRPLAESFPDSYPAVAGFYDRVFAGESVHVPAQPLAVGAGGEVFDAYLAPVRGDSGSVVAAHMTGFEVGAKLRAEAALRESEERLRGFGEASTDVLWIRDARTLQWEYLTPAFEAIYGISCDEALRGANFRNWAELIVPEDRARAVDAIRRVRAGEQVVFDYRIRRPSDGAVRWLRNSDFPIPDEAGRVAKVGGTGRDVTAEREAADALAESEGRLQVLVEELQHRTRNLVAVVRSVAERTGRGAADLPDFQARFLDRLAALGRVQGLLSRLREGDRVTFDEVLESELDALGGGDGKVELDGPDGVRLRSGTVQMIAMGLHELATNAAKYGALRQEGARLRVQWRVAPGARGRPRLHVDWKESGVAMPPDGEAPRGSGQGRELIERALPYQLGAKTELEMGADGVRCRMELPVSER